MCNGEGSKVILPLLELQNLELVAESLIVDLQAREELIKMGLERGKRQNGGRRYSRSRHCT